ncbi:MAG: hypothetical protein OEM27_02415 [Nitrospinota bacterium]|nr:hypothetical protein [Nitrospinota bacterium]
MSTAYFIVLDNEDVDFDSFVNGKFIAQEAEKINIISAKLGLKSIEDFVSQDLEDFGVESEDLGGFSSKWFDPSEGLEWASKIRERVLHNPGSVKNKDGILEDLNDYINVFENAKKVNAQWHFEIDF